MGEAKIMRMGLGEYQASSKKVKPLKEEKLVVRGGDVVGGV